jgi:CBS domain containing-hemolysin-like protein
MFDLNFPESDEYVTIGGYILHKIQRFPKPNEILEIENYSFKVVKVTPTKIELIKMRSAQ